MTSRTFFVSLCFKIRTSPVPRSFHSLDSLSKRKSFARLGKTGYVHLELDFLVLLVGLHLDLVLELDHRLKLGLMLGLSALRLAIRHTLVSVSFVSCSDIVGSEEVGRRDARDMTT